jgi:phage-related protein
MSTNVGSVDFELLLNSNPFNKGIKTATNTIKSSGIENSLKKIGKLAVAAFSVKAIVNFGKECIDLGSNLTEVQNVVDVTFGNLNTEVNRFAENAITQFGLGQTVTKKYVGTFGAMAKAFNFSNKEALAMSETLTGLTGDVASFYNLSSDEAYTKLKSVFTGETETLKDLGVVMTQNALDQYALANGYGKTTSKMSEQEKVALRYKFVLDKLNIANGDFARTSDSWANQTRVLSLRFNELKATLGQGFINIFTPIVKGINMVLSKLQVLANAFKSFTEMIFGNAGGDDSSNSVSNLASDASKASDAVGSIGDSAKKTKKDLLGLRGIDEINNLTTSSDDTSSSSGAGKIDTNGLNLTDNLKKQASDIGKIFGDINFEPLINSFNKVKETAQPLITTIKDGLKWLYDNVLVPLAKWTIQDLLPAFLNLVAGALTVLNPLITAFEPIFQWFWNNFLEPVAKWTGGVIVDTLNLLADVLTEIGNWMSNNQSVVTGMEIAVLGFFSAWKVVELMSFIQQAGGVIAALGLLKNAILGNVIAKIADKAETIALTLMYAKDFVVSIASGTAALVKQAAQWVINTGAKIANTAATIAGTVATTAATTATWLFNAALAVLTSPITLVVAAIAALIAIVVLLIKNWDKVKETASKCWEGIKNAWNNAGQWFNEKIVTPIKNFFENLWNNIKNTASGAWQGIKGIFSGVGSWFSSKFQEAYYGITRIFSNIGSFFSGIWNRIKYTFSSLGTSIGNAISGAVRSGINGVISMIERTVNRAISLINGGINLINKIPGVYVGHVPSLYLPRLAQGGYVKANTPQLAMIGDNRHQGEVVAPEDKLHSIMSEELSKFQGNGNNSEVISLLKEILKYLRNSSGDTVLNIDNIELARTVIKGMKALQAKSDKPILDFI